MDKVKIAHTLETLVNLLQALADFITAVQSHLHLAPRQSTTLAEGSSVEPDRTV